MFGCKEKDNGANREEKLGKAEAIVETTTETEERPDAKPAHEDLSPKKIIEMARTLAESVKLTGEKTWVAVKEKSERAVEAIVWPEPALQVVLDTSSEARSALDELPARVGEHTGV